MPPNNQNTLYNLPDNTKTYTTDEDVRNIVYAMLFNLTQPLKVVAGFLRSDNYVQGVSGWQLTNQGAEINGGLAVTSINIPNATSANSFHVDANGNTWWGATTLGASIASVTNAGAATFSNVLITGGLIQTATSGKRIQITTSAQGGQNANSLALYDSSGTQVLDFGSDSSILMRILPSSDIIGLLVQSPSGVASSNTLASISINSATATATALAIQTAALGTNGVDITHYSGGAPTNMVKITRSNNTGRNLNLSVSGTGSNGLYIEATSSSYTGNLFYLTSAGDSTSYFINSNGSMTNPVLTISSGTTSGGVPLSLQQSASVTGGFSQIAIINGIKIWCGNGSTSPNANISSAQGSLCFNADSGKSYYNNNGSTGWTSM